MSDAPPPVRAEATSERHPAGPLTPERIDAILADFRAWLEALNGAPEVDTARAPEPVDLHTLAAQFTALRHEVNLQTRATRAATEALQRPDAPPDDDRSRPLMKALLDIADALAVAYRQVDRARDTIKPLLADLSAPPAEQPGFFARLFGGTSAPQLEQVKAASEKLQPILAGVADGYALSLNRVERVLPQFGVEPIDCEGELFDPETMEVLEVVDAPGQPTGTVVEEVRRGYRWNGKLLRFAQVKVAR